MIPFPGNTFSYIVADPPLFCPVRNIVIHRRGTGEWWMFYTAFTSADLERWEFTGRVNVGAGVQKAAGAPRGR